MFSHVAQHRASGRRAAYQLPAGRHGIPPEEVARNQRERILIACASVSSVAGYGAMSVEDIIGTAGVSRRTFYDHFKSKQDAFLAAYDRAVGFLQDGMRASFEQGGAFAERMARCLRTLNDVLNSEPALTEMCIVEVLAAGPEAIERRNAAMQQVADMIDEAAATELGEERPPLVVAEALVGGIFEVVYSRVLRGRLDELHALEPELIHTIALPYVGPEAAQAAREQALAAAAS